MASGHSVEDVLLPAKLRIAAGLAAVRLRLGHDLRPAAAVPHGDAMAPPKLTGDTPGADALHPLQVHPVEPLGPEADASLLDGLDSGTSQLLHLHPPLQGDERLDPGTAALAVPHGVPVGLGALQEPLAGERLADAALRLPLGKPCVLARLLAHAPV